jgi:hypothetical protein
MTTPKFAPGHGSLPASANRAGFESDHQLLYVARAAHAGGVHVGKYRRGWNAASISYGGAEIWLDDYEVWYGRLSDSSGGVWNSPDNVGDAVACGHEADLAPLYAARARVNGSLQLGKWHKGWRAAAIPYGGTELWIERFEVLCSGTYFEGDPEFSWEQP